jgi:hypothetical protein
MPTTTTTRTTKGGRSIVGGRNPDVSRGETCPVSILGDENVSFRSGELVRAAPENRGIIRQNPRICPKCILLLFPACYWNLSTTLDPVDAVETVELVMLENLLIVTSKLFPQLFNLCDATQNDQLNRWEMELEINFLEFFFFIANLLTQYTI